MYQLLNLLENNTTKSSTEEQSSAIIVHEPKRTATSTRTIHTTQNKPYRLGAAAAGVVGTPSRCCPAATVPAAVVFGCGFRCCFAEIAKYIYIYIYLAITLLLKLQEQKTIKSSTEKQGSALIVHKPNRPATST